MLHLPKKTYFVCMIVQQQILIPLPADGKARKAWHSYLFIRHRCLHFRLQAGSGVVIALVVVVKPASLVVSCGGHRPPTNATNQTNQCFDWKGHTSNTPCISLSLLSVSALSGADGAAREHEMGVNSRPIHNVSSWYAVNMERSSVVC